MTQHFWDERLETLPAEQRQVLRDHRLHWQVRRCWDGSPFYRARLEAAGLDAALSGGLATWRRLPAVRADDLPMVAAWAVAPDSWWVRVDDVPGQPGRVVTDGDAIQLIDLVARALWAAGARPGQTFPLPDATLDPPTRAAIMAGAGRVKVALAGVRSPAEAPLPIISRPFLVPLACRCRAGQRLHWNDDQFLVEIVDPTSSEPVPNGTVGALVVTDLAREGSPLLRFWTGQEAMIDETSCACGRTSAWTASLRPLR